MTALNADEKAQWDEILEGAPDKCWTLSNHRDRYLDTYISAVQNDLLNAYKKTNPVCNNLSADESKALISLRHRDDTVIKPEDKGGTIVIINNTDYIKEGFRQLSDQNFYKELPSDPTQQLELEIACSLTALFENGDITKDMFKAIKPNQSAAGHFYLLPKIPKTNTSGRPIVSCNHTPTESVSSFLDFLLNNAVPTIRAPTTF